MVPEISFGVEWPPVPRLHQNHLSCWKPGFPAHWADAGVQVAR